MSDRKFTRDEVRRAAQRLLYRPADGAHAQHRTVWCARTVLGDGVRLLRAVDGSRARIGGLHTCGNVWTCAVCSAKVAEARRAELLAGMAAWKAARGGDVLLQTQTFPHERDGYQLAELIDRFAAAQKTFKQSAVYKRAKMTLARAGGVRSLEVTFGDEHGWHPHAHELLFVGVDVTKLPGVRLVEDDTGRHYCGGVFDALRDAWIVALEKHGLGGAREHMLRHAYDVRPGDYAAEYVAKFGRDLDDWTAADELSRAHAKIGLRRGQYTPFQMLALWLAGDAPDFAERFRTYADAFADRRMLYWSPKLKAALGIADLSDDEIAQRLGGREPLPDEEVAGHLTVEQYSTVYSRGAVDELLQLVALLSDRDQAQRQLVIDEWVKFCAGRVPLWSQRLRYRRWAPSGAGRTVEEYAPSSRC
jgi:hypothetical protein